MGLGPRTQSGTLGGEQAPKFCNGLQAWVWVGPGWVWQSLSVNPSRTSPTQPIATAPGLESGL